MLSIQKATRIVKEAFPDGKITAIVEYKNLFLFQMFVPNRPFEELLSPYFSVDRITEEFKDYCLWADGNVKEKEALFMSALKKS